MNKLAVDKVSIVFGTHGTTASRTKPTAQIQSDAGGLAAAIHAVTNTLAVAKIVSVSVCKVKGNLYMAVIVWDST